jgi:hypothetical protein
MSSGESLDDQEDHDVRVDEGPREPSELCGMCPARKHVANSIASNWTLMSSRFLIL